jgi:3-hydroxyacyl-CoA dehydrogenase
VLDTKILMRTLQINVVGTINVCKFAAAAMLKNEPMGHYKERGVLINISSVAGFEGQRGQVPYAASKGAINAITLPMARDLGRFGIRVVTVAPGVPYVNSKHRSSKHPWLTPSTISTSKH